MFSGRTNRATYWTGVAVILILMIVIGVVTRKPPHIAEVVLIILGVPRLHDIGKSGWLVLWPIGLEVVGAICAFGFLPLESAMAVMGLVVLIIAGLMIWLGCIRGQDVENRFGPPPSPGIGWKKPGRA
jgi:uncharacterized membrane protein YhaH (DUF805 family)